jgi:hypothetical protein
VGAARLVAAGGHRGCHPRHRGACRGTRPPRSPRQRA